MKYKLAFLLALFYVYLPPIIMFDICKVYPIWVPHCNGEGYDIDDKFGIAMLEIRENLMEINKGICEFIERAKPIIEDFAMSLQEVMKNEHFNQEH